LDANGAMTDPQNTANRYAGPTGIATCDRFETGCSPIRLELARSRASAFPHVPGIQPADVQELMDNGAEVIVLSEGILNYLRV